MNNTIHFILNVFQNGYVIVNFKNKKNLYAIQEQIKSIFFSDPTRLHTQKINDDRYLHLIKTAKDIIVEQAFVKNFLLDNIKYFAAFFGSDIDFQNNIHWFVNC